MKFKNKFGFNQEYTQYKGNLHSHTINSDGFLTPAESAKLFKDNGYSFMCFSEHDKYTDLRDEFNEDDFIILPALEASANLYDKRNNRLKTHHMHGILGTSQMQKNADKLFENMEILPPPTYYGSWKGGEVAQELCCKLAERGCFVTYNHPIWSRVLPEEFINVKGVAALEIFNYGTVEESGTGADTTFWDMILRSGRQIYAFASDDNHNSPQLPDACGGWINVAAPALTHDDIVTAILKGEYYSSSGPEIYGWGITDDTAWVKCSECERVNFIAGGFINAGTTVIDRVGDGLTNAEYKLRGDETYIRVECIDKTGKTAWSNAIFTEKY